MGGSDHLSAAPILGLRTVTRHQQPWLRNANIDHLCIHRQAREALGVEWIWHSWHRECTKAAPASHTALEIRHYSTTQRAVPPLP